MANVANEVNNTSISSVTASSSSLQIPPSFTPQSSAAKPALAGSVLGKHALSDDVEVPVTWGVTVADLKQGTGAEDLTDMFDQQNFTDASVTCGNKTWKVHRVILCHRSQWFAKALGGSFKEASTGQIEIHEQEPSKVGWILRYLYSGHLGFLGIDLFKPQTIHATCVDFFNLADFYCLTDLKTMICRLLDKYHMAVAARFQRQYDKLAENGQKYSSSSPYRKPMMEQARIIFENPDLYSPLCYEFLRLFQYTRYLLLEDPKFHRDLTVAPVFAAAILRRVFESKSDLMMKQLPQRCRICKRRVLSEPEEGEPNFFVRTWLCRSKDTPSTDELTGVCKLCYDNKPGSAEIKGEKS